MVIRFSVILSLILLSLPVLSVENIELQALLGKKVVVQIDGVRRTLSSGKAAPEGVKLVSVERDGATLEVNGVLKKYSLGSAVSLSYKKPESIKEKVFANDRGMFLQTGTINGRPVRFLIDTGATTIAMNKQQAKSLGIKYRLNGKVSSASTASGFVKAYAVTLKKVSLGGIQQRNVSAMVIDGNHPGPILLGMSFLSKLKVSNAGGVMTLRQRK